MLKQEQLLARAATLVSMLRGTPVVKLEHERLDLSVKLEYCNAVGSIKDRPALWILKTAIERGEVDPQTTVVESSSGNFAIALAAYAQLLGLDYIPVIDPHISAVNEHVLRSLCARVVKVEERDDTGGFLKTRLARVQSLCAALPSSYWPNQYKNPDGMMAHFHTTGREICEAFTALDFVFVAVSSAGTIAGLSRRLKEHFPGVKIVAVDAEGSVIFGGPPRPRRIPGIGAGVVPDLLREALIDDVVIVPEVESIAACRTLLDRHKLLVGGSTGTVYAAIQRYFSKATGLVRPKVLFLCADRGVPYLDTVYNPAWASRYAEG
ncbi:2,3-diaminopropionate biosynthesis protein SbnA [Sorangium atrum]|uniref:2,3-diaminopropionate biosynthesis protein SbnA n=1 Tax=Sorangium atrum TaxID=2995308 RepID=A0ABT5CFC7_9BACT|nr:2,3-diaminopropionate biosynthesis protein SbnA [Sorangium aterium]MDC0685107.1 2,3-diaminopropionate biosynthesis protein SbnA [Sorangium aterium]